jgi:hypothetical protein
MCLRFESLPIWIRPAKSPLQVALVIHRQAFELFVSHDVLALLYRWYAQQTANRSEQVRLRSRRLPFAAASPWTNYLCCGEEDFGRQLISR